VATPSQEGVGLAKNGGIGDTMGMDTQSKDFDYFLNNLESLYKQYGHKFVVVKNEGILGVYDTFETALYTTLKTEQLGTFLVQECFENKEKMMHHFQCNVAAAPQKAA
jgi:hypothetical protein